MADPLSVGGAVLGIVATAVAIASRLWPASSDRATALPPAPAPQPSHPSIGVSADAFEALVERVAGLETRERVAGLETRERVAGLETRERETAKERATYEADVKASVASIRERLRIRREERDRGSEG